MKLARDPETLTAVDRDGALPCVGARRRKAALGVGMLSLSALAACGASSRNATDDASVGQSEQSPKGTGHRADGAAEASRHPGGPAADAGSAKDAGTAPDAGSATDAGTAPAVWTSDMFAGHVRGFNQPGDLSPSSMAALAASGANVARYFVELSPNTGDITTATAYTYDPTPLASIVASAGQLTFKVVIVLDDPKDTETDNEIWQDNAQGASLQASLVTIWQSIATAYKGNAAVAAYDLFNEPVATGGQSQWLSIATTLANAIRAIDPDHVLIFEPTPWAEAAAYSGDTSSSPLTGPLPFDNMVYSFHNYSPGSITSQGLQSYLTSETYPSSSVDASALPALMDLQAVIDFQQAHGVVVYGSELGCVQYAPLASNNQPSCYNWLSDTLPLYEAQHWSWDFNGWRGWYGWDAEMPESWFYQFPYEAGAPMLDWSLYVDAGPPGEPDGALNPHVGFGTYRSDATDTMVLLRQYFQLNP